MSPLRVLSADSTLHGLKACLSSAQQTIGTPIKLATDHGHNIRNAILQGGLNADIVLLPADMISELAANNIVGETVALGSVGIGGVVCAGVTHPAIGTMADLRAALVAADAILLTRAPTGDHLLNVIDQFGLRDVVAQKLLRFHTGTRLNHDLAGRNKNALGFAPETEIRASPGVAYVGDVPDEIQIALPYAAAALTAAASSAAARAFLQFLKTPSARAAFAANGVRFAE